MNGKGGKKNGTFVESLIARIRLGKSPQEAFGEVWLTASLDAVAVVQAGKIFLTTTESEIFLSSFEQVSYLSPAFILKANKSLKRMKNEGRLKLKIENLISKKF